MYLQLKLKQHFEEEVLSMLCMLHKFGRLKELELVGDPVLQLFLRFWSLRWLKRATILDVVF